MVKLCKVCSLIAKSPPIKDETWPTTDRAWNKIRVDFTGPINGAYYLAVAYRITKWPEVLKMQTTDYHYNC